MDENTKIRKQNMKIYALYRAISCDRVFFYAIYFLFLNQVKNISSSDIVLSSAFYAIFMIFLQIPASIIVDKIGTRKCTIAGNIFGFMHVLLIMFCGNLGSLIFAQFIDAICYSLKDISDVTLIQYSIPESKSQGEIFSKLEGKGSKNYYLLNAITFVCSGFLYVINPYLPMIGALCFHSLAIFMSLGFEDVKKEEESQTTEKYIKDLWQGVKFIMKSQRLRSLFLYSGITWGIFCLMGSYRASLLVDMRTSEQIITIIAAIVSIASSIGSRKQIQFHNYFRNKSLSAILFMITFAILIIGIVGMANIWYGFALSMVVIGFALIDFLKGISGVLCTRYLRNFANDEILTQIYAVNAISRNVFRASISFLGAYLLRITNTTNSMILLGIILLITTLGLVAYMKTRLGLKPEEYSKDEFYEKEKVKSA